MSYPTCIPLHMSALTPATQRFLGARGVEKIVVFALEMRLKFRRITLREGILMRGENQWGEFSPFWDYGVEESATWLAAGLEQAGGPGGVLSGFTPPAQVGVNVTVPVISPEAAHKMVAVSQARTAKVKVADPGSSLKADMARLEAVRDALGPGGKIRIDANGAWDLETASGAIPILDRAADGLEYVEQPCLQLTDLVRLRAKIEVPVAADESIRRAKDPLMVARTQAADLIIVKVQPLGGLTRGAQIIDQTGLPAVVSSALDTSVGIHAGAQLARIVAPERDHGLGTVSLFTSDICTPMLLPEKGVLPVGQAPKPQLDFQTGAETPTPQSLDLAKRWKERLDACVQVLEKTVDHGQ